MIKTKEDLHHTFIDGSCEELKKKLLEKIKEFGLEINPSAFKNTAIGVDLTLVNRANFYQVDHNGDNLNYYKDVLRYEELTLEDFEEEEEDNNNTENTKYRYEVVDMTPAEIYSAMLNGETFYVKQQEMYWNGNAFWCSCERVRFIEDDHEVCRKVEFTWQDEVIEKLRSLNLKGCPNTYQAPISDILEYPDVFLELARVALRATGELK